MKKAASIFLVGTLLFSLGACKNAAYKEAMEKADTAIKDKEYEEAISYYETAIEEKSDDETAIFRLDLTERFIQAEDKLAAGDVNEAEALFSEITESNDEEEFLYNDAAIQLVTIDELKETYTTIEKALAKVEEYDEEKDYEEALKIVEGTKETDLSHAYLAALEEELKTREETIVRKQMIAKEQAAIEETITEIKGLADQAAYKKAIKKIDATLEDEMTDETKEKYKDELENLKSDYNEVIEATKRAKAMYGYWQNDRYANDIIYVQPNYLVNLVYQSDVSFSVEVDYYIVDIINNEFIVQPPDGSTITYGYYKDQIQAPQGNYTKKTKEEIKEAYPYIDFDDFTEEKALELR